MFSGTPIDYQNAPIENNGFWPDLNLRDFQESRGIPADLPASLQLEKLLIAVSEVNALLAQQEIKHKTAGYDTAADIPGATVNGENSTVAQYKAAVFARAKADLLPNLASLGRRKDNPAQESPETSAGLIAESSRAIRALKGLSRIGVALL